MSHPCEPETHGSAVGVYVMPSVSEPFGIALLETMNHDVRVIISKQSGVSEVLTHALKVDFWDISESKRAIAVLGGRSGG